MPRVIDTAQAGAAIGLDELVDLLDASGFDPRDEDAFAALGPALARLGRNRTFLSDLAITELETRFAGQAANAYNAQSLLLRPANGRYLLRANFWPAATDAAMRASGAASFFYHMPHDHNFSFLTHGYLGPGYWSDYYLFDGAAAGLAGEPVTLAFDERSRLSPGRTMLYRAHRDVHVQLPPDAFSVSLNVLGAHPAQMWRTQYRFDIAGGRIAEPLTTTPSEALVAIACALGGEEGVALTCEIARRHPASRMRTTALRAAARALPPGERQTLLEKAVADRDHHVAAHARAFLAMPA